MRPPFLFFTWYWVGCSMPDFEYHSCWKGGPCFQLPCRFCHFFYYLFYCFGRRVGEFPFKRKQPTKDALLFPMDTHLSWGPAKGQGGGLTKTGLGLPLEKLALKIVWACALSMVGDGKVRLVLTGVLQCFGGNRWAFGVPSCSRYFAWRPGT